MLRVGKIDKLCANSHYFIIMEHIIMTLYNYPPNGIFGITVYI